MVEIGIQSCIVFNRAYFKTKSFEKLYVEYFKLKAVRVKGMYFGVFEAMARHSQVKLPMTGFLDVFPAA